MTSEQCHLVCCNLQQVEESAGWDRYSSSDTYDQQMDGQDEWSRRIYNNRNLTKRGAGRSKFLGLLKALTVKHRRTDEEEELILGPNQRISLYPSSTPLTIPFPYDPVRLLNKPSLRPSS